MSGGEREYLKRQEELRAMGRVSSNARSADDMIHHLLSNKEIFKKKKEGSELPKWVRPGEEEPFYLKVWGLVDGGGGYADTAKLTNLLLTSQLSTDTLGFIWSLTNKTVAGVLTQQETYCTLGLVALAQAGSRFTSVAALSDVKEAVIPSLALWALPQPPPASVFVAAPPSLMDDDQDDFDEFKSAEVSGVTREDVLPIKEELPPSSDKYSALRLLAPLSPPPPPQQDDFGDFLTAEPSSPPIPLLGHTDNIQVKCLEACVKVLAEGVGIFEAITDQTVLGEVTSDPRGIKYLEELVEVKKVGERIVSNLKEPLELCDKMNVMSQRLDPFISKHSKSFMEYSGGAKCGVCLSEEGPHHVRYGINTFHAPCANLLLHFVQPSLPIAPLL